MKILFILLFLSFVSATNLHLSPGESFLLDDKNITLVKIDATFDRGVFCVNGVQGIIEEDKTKMVSDVIVNVKDITRNGAELDVAYKCKNCICTSCDNSRCFKTEETPLFEEKHIEQEAVDFVKIEESGPVRLSQDEIISRPPLGIGSIFFTFLIFFVIVLGLVVLRKKL